MNIAKFLRTTFFIEPIRWLKISLKSIEIASVLLGYEILLKY